MNPLAELQQEARHVCHDCKREYAPWFVSSGIWERVIGAHQGMLCPSCFTIRASKVMAVKEWFLTPLLNNHRLPDDPDHEIRYSEMERLSRIAAQSEKKGREIEEKYQELILAVGSVHPRETRHETALRYILQAEEGSSITARSSEEGKNLS